MAKRSFLTGRPPRGDGAISPLQRTASPFKPRMIRQLGGRGGGFRACRWRDYRPHHHNKSKVMGRWAAGRISSGRFLLHFALFGTRLHRSANFYGFLAKNRSFRADKLRPVPQLLRRPPLPGRTLATTDDCQRLRRTKAARDRWHVRRRAGWRRWGSVFAIPSPGVSPLGLARTAS